MAAPTVARPRPIRPGRVETCFLDAYDGPVAVLVGPGAVSAGHLSVIWAGYLPCVRTFGKSTSVAPGLPTQSVLEAGLDFGPDWFASVAETNSYASTRQRII